MSTAHNQKPTANSRDCCIAPFLTEGFYFLTAARYESAACDGGRFISPKEFLLPQTYAERTRFTCAPHPDGCMRAIAMHTSARVCAVCVRKKSSACRYRQNYINRRCLLLNHIVCFSHGRFYFSHAEHADLRRTHTFHLCSPSGMLGTG